jgi:hypothetical protein
MVQPCPLFVPFLSLSCDYLVPCLSLICPFGVYIVLF